MSNHDDKNLPNRKFGLLTSIAMIVGIVIGSGIFFKTPQIIEKVQGNMAMGILVFVIGAFGIIFGGLTISQYAQNDNSVGGIISYCETAWGKTAGYIAGWFQVIFYYPALISVISWVAAQYTCALFGIPNLLINGQFGWEVWVLAVIYMIAIFAFNSFATKKAGSFQVFAMFAKLAALIVLGISGILFGNPVEAVASSVNYPSSTVGLLAGVVVVAFAFDGWLVSLSVAHEVKNPKKNLPKALTIAPIIITIIYLLYFIGVTSYVGPGNILGGTDPVQTLAFGIFGSFGMKIVLVFIVISVLGTLNGLILGYIRLPYALAIRNEIPMAKSLSKIHKKYDIPLASSVFACAITACWLLLHFLSLDGAILYGATIFTGLEVDNLPIVLTYIFYILLYLGIIMKPTPNKSILSKYIFPILAIIGALVVVYGGLIQPKFNVYLIICIVGIIAGLLIRPKKSG